MKEVAKMKVDHGNWNETEWEPLRPGIKRVVFGMAAKSMSCTIGEVVPGHETKPHHHPQEQIALIVQGTCDYYVDGVPYAMKPGSWVVVPPNVEHYIHVYDTKEPVLNMDIFVPGRPEYTEVFTKFLNRNAQESK